MDYEVEFFVDAMDEYKKAYKDRADDPDGFIGDDSPTWIALNRARTALRDTFRRAVLAVLGK